MDLSMHRVLRSRALLFAAGLALVLGLGLATLPRTLGGEFARQKVADAFREATGREPVFEGGTRVALWPRAAIEFDDVLLPGAAAGDPPVARIGTLRLRVAAGALLRRSLAVEEIALLRPVFELRQDDDGRLNFVDPPAGDDRPPEPESGDAPRILIEDGTLRYRDLRSGRDFEAADLDLAVTASSTAGPVDLNGHLTWRDRRVGIALHLAAPGRLAADGSPADLAVEAPELTAGFGGRLALKRGIELVGQVEARSPALADLARWGGVGLGRLEVLRDATVTAALDLQDRTLRLKEARLGLDGMQASGDITVALSGDRPRVEARLETELLDLNPYAAPRETGNALADGWSGAPVALSGLSGLNAALHIQVGAIRYGRLLTEAGAFKASLTDGALELELDTLALHGGSASGRLALEQGGGKLQLRGAFEARDVEAGSLLRDLAGLDLVSGRGHLSLFLSARGGSEIELASTLAGTLGLTLADGALDGVDVPALIARAASGGGSGWGLEPGRRTAFTSLDARFSVADGVAEAMALALRGPGLDIAATGSVDLLSQRVDLKAVVDQPPPRVELSLNGPWLAPSIDRGKGDAGALTAAPARGPDANAPVQRP